MEDVTNQLFLLIYNLFIYCPDELAHHSGQASVPPTLPRNTGCRGAGTAVLVVSRRAGYQLGRHSGQSAMESESYSLICRFQHTSVFCFQHTSVFVFKAL